MITATISDQGAPPAPHDPPTWSETILHMLWSSTGAFRSNRQDACFGSTVWIASWLEWAIRMGEPLSDQATTDKVNVLLARHVAWPATPEFHSPPFKQPNWKVFLDGVEDAVFYPELTLPR